MSGRAVQTFLPLEPPTVTHNDLEAYVIRHNGRAAARIRKSDKLKDAESALMAALAICVPDKPLAGPLRLTVRWCFATEDKHEQGEPHTDKPDVDNMAKTFCDCLTRVKIIEDDCLVVDERLSKAWADPAGIWIKVQELEV